MKEIWLKEWEIRFFKDGDQWKFFDCGVLCHADRNTVRKYIEEEKVLRSFSKAPKLVFELITEGYRGPFRRSCLSQWEADFAEDVLKRERFSEKQISIMKRIIIKILRTGTVHPLAVAVTPAELVGSTKRKQVLQFMLLPHISELRKMGKEKIQEIEKLWKAS